MRSTLPLVLVLTIGGCADDMDRSVDAPGDGADQGDVFDQESADVTVIRASTDESIEGQGALGFSLDECDSFDSFSVNCTRAFEDHHGRPAIHPILVPKTGSQFFCRILRIQTASKTAAIDNSEGVGFFYRGWTPADIRFVPRDNLAIVGKGTLESGDEATIHEFVGLANCFLGSASSSFAATYEFKPFMAFTGSDGTLFRNWDLADNYVVSHSIPQFDRSAEILSEERRLD